jgi:hypothetical protein
VRDGAPLRGVQMYALAGRLRAAGLAVQATP